jgi:6-phospho-3-hexuloisomerase
MNNTFQQTKTIIIEELNESLSRIDNQEVEKIINEIVLANRVFVTGAGRMGIMMSTFSMRLNHLGFSSYIVGSINCPPITDGDLLIVASSSGETATIREISVLAKNKGAKIALITAVPNSTIGKIDSLSMKIEAPSSLVSEEGHNLQSRQPMKTLFEQTLFIVLESMVLMHIEHTGQSIVEMAKRHANLE